jgi:hypothetical protein
VVWSTPVAADQDTVSGEVRAPSRRSVTCLASPPWSSLLAPTRSSRSGGGPEPELRRHPLSVEQPAAHFEHEYRVLVSTPYLRDNASPRTRADLVQLAPDTFSHGHPSYAPASYSGGGISLRRKWHIRQPRRIDRDCGCDSARPVRITVDAPVIAGLLGTNVDRFDTSAGCVSVLR